jgi:hypothetical protein
MAAVTFEEEIFSAIEGRGPDNPASLSDKEGLARAEREYGRRFWRTYRRLNGGRGIGRRPRVNDARPASTESDPR